MIMRIILCMITIITRKIVILNLHTGPFIVSDEPTATLQARHQSPGLQRSPHLTPAAVSLKKLSAPHFSRLFLTRGCNPIYLNEVTQKCMILWM